MANPAGLCPIKTTPAYGVGVTEPAPEPTNADLLAFMQTAFAHLSTEISGVKTDIADLSQDLRNTEAALAGRIDSVSHALRSLKEDVARHLDDPNAHGHAA